MSAKKFFSPKINQNRVANNDFDHEDRLGFPINGEKIHFGHFSTFLKPAVLKVQNFRQY
jgi:hypothetical protein